MAHLPSLVYILSYHLKSVQQRIIMTTYLGCLVEYTIGQAQITMRVLIAQNKALRLNSTADR